MMDHSKTAFHKHFMITIFRFVIHCIAVLMYVAFVDAFQM